MLRRMARFFVAGLLASARPDSRLGSIFIPVDGQPGEGFKPKVKHRTIREAARWGLASGPMHYRVLADLIDRAPNSVAAVLSNMPEFQPVNSGTGYWQLHPHFARAGWVTVGR